LASRRSRRNSSGITEQYWVRNIHPQRMHVMVGDLGYKVPWGQSRNLLSPTSGLDPARVKKSAKGGSLRKRLDQRILVEVSGPPDLRPPRLSVAPPDSLSFPYRSKSGISVDEGDVAEELQSSIIADDDNLIREMEIDMDGDGDGDNDMTEGGIPIMASEEKGKG